MLSANRRPEKGIKKLWGLWNTPEALVQIASLGSVSLVALRRPLVRVRSRLCRGPAIWRRQSSRGFQSTAYMCVFLAYQLAIFCNTPTEDHCLDRRGCDEVWQISAVTTDRRRLPSK